jgi:hydrogenase maturation protease
MSVDRIRAIADAVLYEGYLLYPYRPSSIKNRQRWTFGGVFPADFAGKQGDAAEMQTEVLVEGRDPSIDVHIRFLQVLDRTVGKFAEPIAEIGETDELTLSLVPSLEVEGREYLAWEEAVEREIVVPGLRLAGLPHRTSFAFDAARTLEPVRTDAGAITGALIRTSCAITGLVEIAVYAIADDLTRLTVRIENTTPISLAVSADRAEAQRRAFASTHTIVEVHGGDFVSLTDPPDDLREAAARCANHGTWPVLVGRASDRNAILSSPIILPDYPRIAPESPGDLFDGTEIDEILTLRILAMTDAEKREMAAADPRARALLERTHALTPAEMARLHGTMRQPPHADADLAIGSQVRLRPKAGGDIMDIVLKDKIAVIEAVECDFEDRIHIAVTLLDDPGRDLGAAGFPGHRFYFARDEIEPLSEPAA